MTPAPAWSHLLQRALDLPGATPTGYGLGKAGWVTIPLGEGIALALCEELLLESYRAVAPKKLLKLLG